MILQILIDYLPQRRTLGRNQRALVLWGVVCFVVAQGVGVAAAEGVGRDELGQLLELLHQLGEACMAEVNRRFLEPCGGIGSMNEWRT